MKKTLLFGNLDKKTMLLANPKSGELISKRVGDTITITSLVKITEIPTVDSETGEVGSYETAIAKTSEGDIIAIPNAVAVDTFTQFLEALIEEEVDANSITMKVKEVKASSGNKYIDIDIVDFE